jgi:hypothetical protein
MLLDKAKKLIEQGFEYVTEIDSIKLFRKRKQGSVNPWAYHRKGLW